MSSASSSVASRVAERSHSSASYVECVCALRMPSTASGCSLAQFLFHEESDDGRVSFDTSSITKITIDASEMNMTSSPSLSRDSQSVHDKKLIEENAQLAALKIKASIPTNVTFGFSRIFDAANFTNGNEASTNQGSQLNAPANAVGKYHQNIFETTILPRLYQTLFQGRSGCAIVMGPTGCGKTQLLIRGPKGLVQQSLQHTLSQARIRNEEFTKSGSWFRFDVSLSSILISPTFGKNQRANNVEAKPIIDLLDGFVTDEQHRLRRRNQRQVTSTSKNDDDDLHSPRQPINNAKDVVVALHDSAAEKLSRTHSLVSSPLPSSLASKLEQERKNNTATEAQDYSTQSLSEGIKQKCPRILFEWRKQSSRGQLQNEELSSEDEACHENLPNKRESVYPHVTIEDITQVPLTDPDETNEALRYALHNAKQQQQQHQHGQTLSNIPSEPKVAYHMVTTITLTCTSLPRAQKASHSSRSVSELSHDNNMQQSSSLMSTFARFHFVELCCSNGVICGAPSESVVSEGEAKSTSTPVLSDCIRSIAAVAKQPEKIKAFLPSSSRKRHEVQDNSPLLLRLLADSLIPLQMVSSFTEALFPQPLFVSGIEVSALSVPDSPLHEPETLNSETKPFRPATASLSRSKNELSHLNGRGSHSQQYLMKKEAWGDTAAEDEVLNENPESATKRLSSSSTSAVSSVSETQNQGPVCVWISMFLTASRPIALALNNLVDGTISTHHVWPAILNYADQIYFSYQILRLSAAVSGLMPRKRRTAQPKVQTDEQLSSEELSRSKTDRAVKEQDTVNTIIVVPSTAVSSVDISKFNATEDPLEKADPLPSELEVLKALPHQTEITVPIKPSLISFTPAPTPIVSQATSSSSQAVQISGAQVRMRAALFSLDNCFKGHLTAHLLPTLLTRICSLNHAALTGRRPTFSSHAFLSPSSGAINVYSESTIVTPLLSCEVLKTHCSLPMYLRGLYEAFYLIALPRFASTSPSTSATSQESSPNNSSAGVSLPSAKKCKSDSPRVTGLASVLDPSLLQSCGLSHLVSEALRERQTSDIITDVQSTETVSNSPSQSSSRQNYESDEKADPFLRPSPKSRDKSSSSSWTTTADTCHSSAISSYPSATQVNPNNLKQPMLTFNYFIVPFDSFLTPHEATKDAGRCDTFSMLCPSVLINGRIPIYTQIPSVPFASNNARRGSTPEVIPAVGDSCSLNSTSNQLSELIRSSLETGNCISLRNLVEFSGGNLKGYAIFPGDIIQMGPDLKWLLLEDPDISQPEKSVISTSPSQSLLNLATAGSLRCAQKFTGKLGGVPSSLLANTCKEWALHHMDVNSVSVLLSSIQSERNMNCDRVSCLSDLLTAWQKGPMAIPTTPGPFIQTSFTLRQYLTGTWYDYQHPYVSSLLKRLQTEDSKLERNQEKPNASAKEAMEGEITETEEMKKWLSKPFSGQMIKALRATWEPTKALPEYSPSGVTIPNSQCKTVLSAAITNARWELVGLHEDRSETNFSADEKERTMKELMMHAQKTNSHLSALGLPIEFAPVLRPFAGWQVVQELKTKSVLRNMLGSTADLSEASGSSMISIYGIDGYDDYWDRILEDEASEETGEDVWTPLLDLSDLQLKVPQFFKGQKKLVSFDDSFRNTALESDEMIAFGIKSLNEESLVSRFLLDESVHVPQTNNLSDSTSDSPSAQALTTPPFARPWIRSLVSQASSPELDAPCGGLRCSLIASLGDDTIGASIESDKAHVELMIKEDEKKRTESFGIYDKFEIDKLRETMMASKSELNYCHSIVGKDNVEIDVLNVFPRSSESNSDKSIASKISISEISSSSPTPQHERVTQASTRTSCLLDPSRSLWLGFELRILAKDETIKPRSNNKIEKPFKLGDIVRESISEIPQTWIEFLLMQNHSQSSSKTPFYTYPKSGVIAFPISVASFLRRSLAISRMMRFALYLSALLISRPASSSRHLPNYPILSHQRITKTDPESLLIKQMHQSPSSAQIRAPAALLPQQLEYMSSNVPIYQLVLNRTIERFTAGLPAASCPLSMLAASTPSLRYENRASQVPPVPHYVGSMALPLAPIISRLEDFDDCCKIFGKDGAIIARARFELRVRILKALNISKSEKTRLRSERRIAQIKSIRSRLQQTQVTSEEPASESFDDSLAYTSGSSDEEDEYKGVSDESIHTQAFKTNIAKELSQYLPTPKAAKSIVESIGEDLQLQLQLLRVEGLEVPPGFRLAAVMCMRRAVPSSHEQSICRSQTSKTESNESNNIDPRAGYQGNYSDKNPSLEEEEEQCEMNDTEQISRLADLTHRNWGKYGCARVCGCTRMSEEDRKICNLQSLRVLLSRTRHNRCDRVMLSQNVTGSENGIDLTNTFVSFEGLPITRRLIRKVPFGFVQSITDGDDPKLIEMYTQPASQPFIHQPGAGQLPKSPKHRADYSKLDDGQDCNESDFITPTPFEFNISSPYIRVGFWFVPESIVSYEAADVGDHPAGGTNSSLDIWRRFAAKSILDRNILQAKRTGTELALHQLKHRSMK